MVEFTLSKSELAVRDSARSFAQEHLLKAKAIYTSLSSPAERYQSVRPTYAAAVSAGIIKAQIPKALGGTTDGFVEAAIMSEELYSVERSASVTIVATGLGLTPIILGYREELSEFLRPFLSGQGSPVASLVFSEPTGVANWLEPGSPGLQTTAHRSADGSEWIINGDKIWATNSAGWDFRGADLACVVCRCADEELLTGAKSPEDKIMIILVTAEDIKRSGEASFEVIRHQEVPGHKAASSPHIRYTNVRVPIKNVLCPPGKGAALVIASFITSAALVGAMSVGIQRTIFAEALSYSKSQTRGGTTPIGNRQSVADLLINMKMRTEASRYLTWKATHSITVLGPNDASARELALEAKIFCSDSAVQTAVDAINLVGVSAYDGALPFSELLNDAMVLPIFDGGNIGIRRRQLQDILMNEKYQYLTTAYPETSL